MVSIWIITLETNHVHNHCFYFILLGIALQYILSVQNLGGTKPYTKRVFLLTLSFNQLGCHLNATNVISFLYVLLEIFYWKQIKFIAF